VTIKSAVRVKKTSSRAVSKRSAKLRKRAHSKKRNRSTRVRQLKFERNHAATAVAAQPLNFEYTAERKDRTVYYSSLRNGDAENFFGQVVSTNPANQTVTTPNPDLTAAGPATLEVAMQGVNLVDHQVRVKFNGTDLGLVLPPSSQGGFFGQSHVVATFDVPVSLLVNGANTLTFTPPSCPPPMAPCPDTTIIDYTRLTYRHTFSPDLAPGRIRLIGQPNVDDTLVVGGKGYTFKTAPTSNLHIGIGADRAATAINIANRINSDTASTLCSAVASSTEVALIANSPGVSNSITLTVDGLRLTKTDFAKTLKFSLRGTQSGQIDGFASLSMRLLDYTDPLAVRISRPSSQPSGSGYAITVPTSDPPSKPARLLYLVPDGQFEQPASLALNQPSSLNLSSNVADLLVVSHKDFIPSFTKNVPPTNTSFVVAKLQSQGLNVSIVDIDDVYDEFSYGAHGPQAIKDFLRHASTHWNNGNSPLRYIIFAGDATYDPRNYLNFGNYDLLPTKLIDDNYTETVSDDWLADFDNDGIADIPLGRIPVRTTAEADLVVAKIVNYSPATVPQTALLVADNPGNPPVWDFESGNDNVQALLPPSMTVQRVNIRTEPSNAQATANIRDGLNQGRAIVNYSGHGNINVWTGASIWTTANANALTNGMDKLSFVVVMDCLNGYFQDPGLLSISEAFLKAPNGGAVAAFASSGLTTTFGQRQMELELYKQLYGGAPIALGDAIKIAKAASGDVDVRTTWIFFGDPSIKIR
jgi:hypothetical protein